MGLSLIATETVCCLVDTANKHITHHAPGAGREIYELKGCQRGSGHTRSCQPGLYGLFDLAEGNQQVSIQGNNGMGTNTEIKWAGAMKS